jgi:aldose 1-epimerase
MAFALTTSLAVLAFSQSAYIAPTAAGYDKWLLSTTVDVKDASGNAIKTPDGVPLQAALVKVVDSATPGAKKVALYTLKNSKGMTVSITNYGAKIEQIMVPDRKGVFSDVVLGYETIDKAVIGQGSFGSFVGRYANRLANGKFSLDGANYQIGLNESKPGGFNTLHGGVLGTRFMVYDAKQLDDSDVEMYYTFKDGEEGFPGVLALRVLYTVTENNELVVDYQSYAATKNTVANFTSHSFFNLSGDLGSEILDHVITINASRFLPYDSRAIPNGKLASVAGTPMDFRAGSTFAARINADFDQLKFGGGYDHYWVLDKRQPRGFELAASAYSPKSGRFMEVFTTEPGIQVHSGNNLAGQKPRDEGKGSLFIFRSGFNMETSRYPDSPNESDFPTTVVKKGEWYTGRTMYRFSVKN